MSKTLALILALVAVSHALTLGHEQFHCCTNGRVYDSRLLECVCPAGTAPTGPNHVCCPPGTIADPRESGKCMCPPPKHLNPATKQCEECLTNHIWDTTKSLCVCPPNLQTENSTGWCTCTPPAFWNENSKAC